MTIDTNKCCDYCRNEFGESGFPYYGLSPGHVHTKDGTLFSEKDTWPENFEEDPEAPGCGTYTHCPQCGGIHD